MSPETRDCLFCVLAAGAGEASIVNEDSRTITLMDIQPVTEGHMLVIPRAHAANLADLEPEDGAHVFRVAQAAAASLRSSGLRCEGVNFFLADGEAAGQEIFHVHMHVFPRYAGDDFGLRLPPDYAVRPRSELDSAAATLRRSWQTVR
jgi:diadenosine tetraphosphate (Ap4A) HIT family hydrolase